MSQAGCAHFTCGAWKGPALLLVLQSTLAACSSLFLELQFSSMRLVRTKGFVSMLKIPVISLLSILN